MSVRISLQKQKMRQVVTAMRRHLAEEGNEARDSQILERLLETDAYQSATLLLTYFSTSLEVDTRKLVLLALEDGKQVALPCCEPSERSLTFYTFQDVMELRRSHYGIFEPPRREENRVTSFAGGLCIVPVLAADGRGNRLGYGGGYYDRFLAANPELPAIGLCYGACCLAEVPSDVYDIPLRLILTEDAVVLG